MSLYLIEEGRERSSILRILKHTYSYLEIERGIIQDNKMINDVIILNQYENISFFLVYENKVTIVSPYKPLNKNEVIYISGMEEELGKCNSNTCYLLKNEKMNSIINAKKILLLNYCNNNKFTVPRLNLSTHTLASFLRANSLARVYLIDMQFDIEDKEVITEIKLLKPDAIGLSVNFGFLNKSFQFLDILYETLKSNNLNTQLILGNIIPALNYRDYIERYPDILISYSEGEMSIKDYMDYINNKKEIEEVSGVYYYDKNKKIIIKNDLKLINMDEIPFIALDTLFDIKKRRGILSLEFSRGCSHSACTFCPRNHKGCKWRYMSAFHMYQLSEKLYNICKEEGISTRIYIADEEFVGYINGEDENKRIIEYFSLLRKNDVHLTIDVSCRVDSIYSPNKGDCFNLKKMEMWQFCSENGLGRVFLGVESFSNNQLARYNKNTNCEQNIIAIKVLTALGIDIRLGILLFDQLMSSISELKENIYVLGRKDIIQNKYRLKDKCENLYYDIIQDFSDSGDIPLYMKTSYLLTVMEVLKESFYFKLCKNEGIDMKENKNWGKYEVPFSNKYIGIMSSYLSKWVDTNYPIVYAIKTFLKSSKDDEYNILNNTLETYKAINYKLVEYLTEYVDDVGLVKSDVTPFSVFFLSDNFRTEKIKVESIEDLFDKTFVEAKDIFRSELQKLDEKMIDKNIKEKLYQLIIKY